MRRDANRETQRMGNVAATQLLAFQAKDLENAQKQAVPPKTEDATN